MKAIIFMCFIILTMSFLAHSYDVPPVSAPVCAYCDAPLTGTTGADHAPGCPYYSTGETSGNTSGSVYTNTGNALGQLIINLFEKLFAPAPDKPVLDDNAKKEAIKRQQAAFAKSVAGALNLLGNRPGITVKPPVIEVYTSANFFGLGPMVVDLRNIRRASYFMQNVETASIEDVQLLLNEAIKAANGAQSSLGNIPPNARVPEINDKGLLVFQQVNKDYANAYESLAKAAKNFKTAEQHRDMVYRTTAVLRAEVEKNMAGKTDKASLKKKQEMLDEIAAVESAEDAACLKAKAQFSAAENQADKAREESVRVLRALALEKDPATFHPPVASIPALKEEIWQDMHKKMIAERQKLDETAGKANKQLASVVPPLKNPERLHEGVIMGFGTDAKDAEKMEKDGVSCFSGKTYSEINRISEQARKDGKDIGGAMVVSFGTPKDKKNYFDPLKTEKSEATRVFLDHMTEGNFSLDTPQGRDAVNRLAGKEFDRLIAHSNGATITEALIRNNVIKVDELNIVGGDRSLLNGHNYQELLDSGKVKRVVVWINVNDPVPGLTSIDQLKLTERSADAAIHLAKKITGNLAAGNAGVEYRIMWGSDYRDPAGADQKASIAAHFVESSYFPGMANEMGVKYVLPKRLYEKK